MAEISKELKSIKKKYGEKFMHLCRDNFASILENENKLSSILEKYFATNTRNLGEDIINSDNIVAFKDFIYSKIDVESKEKDIIEERSPYEVLNEAGYELIECTNEKQIQEFKKYYAPNEVICTIYNGGRLNTSYVFFAVKKDVEDIKRENFENPKREDEYGASVLGIQFDKNWTCMPHIISRYNHTVNNPNGTFGNDLDKIAPGLTESFAGLLQERGKKLNASNIEEFEFPGYTIASDGKYYKYNMEINGNYYCPGNIIIREGEIEKLESPDSQILIDHFIIDMEKKEIKNCNGNMEEDYFDEFFQDKEIENIKVEKEKDNFKKIQIKMVGQNTPIMIKIDKDNQIVGYSNDLIEEAGESFLKYNKSLTKLSLSNAQKIGDRFLYNNNSLTKLSLSNAQKIGDRFLYNNNSLTKLSLPNAKRIGNDFLHENNSLTELSLPNAKNIGYYFLCSNKSLTELSLPNAQKIGINFLCNNKSLTELSLPNAKRIGNGFLDENNSLTELSLPNVQNIESYFLRNNNSLTELSLPNAQKIGERFLYNNNSLTELSLPNAKNIESYFLYNNKSLTQLSLPNAKNIESYFLRNNNSLTGLSLPNVQNISDYFLYKNNSLTELLLPNAQKIGDKFLYNNNSLTEVTIPNMKEIEDRLLQKNKNRRETSKNIDFEIGIEEVKDTITKYLQENHGQLPKIFGELEERLDDESR